MDAEVTILSLEIDFSILRLLVVCSCSIFQIEFPIAQQYFTFEIGILFAVLDASLLNYSLNHRVQRWVLVIPMIPMSTTMIPLIPRWASMKYPKMRLYWNMNILSKSDDLFDNNSQDPQQPKFDEITKRFRAIEENKNKWILRIMKHQVEELRSPVVEHQLFVSPIRKKI